MTEHLVRVDQVVQLWVLHSFLGVIKSDANLNARMNGKLVVILSQKKKKNFSDKKGEKGKCKKGLKNNTISH